MADGIRDEASLLQVLTLISDVSFIQKMKSLLDAILLLQRNYIIIIMSDYEFLRFEWDGVTGFGS